jgi:hypothetical protein
MGIVIVAGAGILLVLAIVVVLATRPRAILGPVGNGEASGFHVGGRCRCGRGQLQFGWVHGMGRILRCSQYPQCRESFQFNGRPLPEWQTKVLREIR